MIVYFEFSFIRKVFGVDYLGDKFFTYGLGVMILLTVYVVYINKDREMFKLNNFINENKSFVINLVINIFSILIVFVMIGLLHMINVSQWMRVIDAWVRSVAVINVGIIFSIMYLAIKNFAVIILWHDYIDFNLFITKFGCLPMTHKIFVILDVLIRIIFAVCIIIMGIKIYKNYKRKKLDKKF